MHKVQLGNPESESVFGTVVTRNSVFGNIKVNDIK